MVKLNKIYTRTGDDGTTGLGSGDRVHKSDLRISAYGTVDETNAAIGIARLHSSAQLDAMLARVQHDLFDLGADLCIPDDGNISALRITPAQVKRLEDEIDLMNADLEPLRSFVLPGGHPSAAYLHLARTIARRAERIIAEMVLHNNRAISANALEYINRLSDFLFVASRHANMSHGGDVMWEPGKTR